LTTIAIIGAGPLGRWLALAAARAGFRVFLEDVMPSNLHHAQEYLRRELSPENLSQAGRGGEGMGDLAPEVVSFVSTVEDAVREADLAIDCVPDELESKLEILWLLDRMAPPRTVFATPTTNLSIDDLASCTYRPERCIAIASSPRTLSDQRSGSTIRLVATARTAPEALALVRTFWERLGFYTSLEAAADSR
jgi:3-hydroxybutyryl-CoA dehydrogenase